MKLAIAIFTITAIALPLYADEKEALLMDGAKEINLLWTEVVGNPALKLDAIPPEKLAKLFGSWKGAYIGSGKKPELSFDLQKDGTWTSKVVGPDVDKDESKDSEQAGNWYLHEGMILLYESPVAKDAELFSALFIEKEKLRLIVVGIKRGFVELTKQK